MEDYKGEENDIPVSILDNSDGTVSGEKEWPHTEVSVCTSLSTEKKTNLYIMNMGKETRIATAVRQRKCISHSSPSYEVGKQVSN